MENYFKIISLLFIFLLSSCNQLVFALDINKDIPKKANSLLPIVKKEAERIHPDFKQSFYYGSLIEHESCLSLTHSRCWSPTSRLKTQREEGAGLGQLTRAYNNDGTPRFDTLTELANRYNEELKDLSWSNIYQRPDLQIKSIILLHKESYSKLFMIPDPDERLKFSDAAYNGGLSGVDKDRRLCRLTSNCNPIIWTNNVELTCSKSKKILYSNRSACDINRHHVHDVTIVRLPKYKKWFEEN